VFAAHLLGSLWTCQMERGDSLDFRTQCLGNPTREWRLELDFPGGCRTCGQVSSWMH